MDQESTGDAPIDADFREKLRLGRKIPRTSAHVHSSGPSVAPWDTDQ